MANATPPARLSHVPPSAWDLKNAGVGQNNMGLEVVGALPNTRAPTVWFKVCEQLFHQPEP